MKKRTYERMKRIIMNLAEWMNTPDEELENMLGIGWYQFHDLRRTLEEEE